MRTVSANLKAHFGQETTTLATCFRLTLTEQQPQISNVTTDSTTITVTTTYAHSLSIGDVVQIVNLIDETDSPQGIAGLNYKHDSNDVYYPVLTVPSDTTFTIADPGISGSYVSGGEVRKTFGITNVDQDLLIDGVTYHADTGGVPSALRNTTGMEIGTMDNIGVYAAANITEQDILTGRVDYAECEVFVVDYTTLTDGKVILEFGFMGQLELKRNHYIAKYDSLSSVLAQDTIRILSPDCPYDLGDSRCGLDVDGSPSFTFTGTATGVGSKTTFTDTSRSEADGYFDGGLLTWTSGPNVGLQMEVQTYTLSPAQIILWEPMPYEISSGSPLDTYQVIAGCNKTFDSCKDKFSNVVNFGGFPYLPGEVQINAVGGKG